MNAPANRLYHSLHTDRVQPRLARRVSLPAPGNLTGMGKLLWLEITIRGRVEQWRFDDPLPRLGFSALTASARGRSHIWLMGGSYRLDGGGFHNLRGASRLRSMPLAKSLRSQPVVVNQFRRTHGGRDPIEAFRTSLVVPDVLVPVGPLYAICYDANKGDGEYPYRHPFDLPCQPVVCCDPTGLQLFVVGGAYTVTPHGIEDADL